jgi:hypothetical protein
MTLNISLDAAWNTGKDIEVTQLDCYGLTVNGFVDTCVGAVGDDMSHDITVIGAKRGAIDLRNGNNNVNIQYLSNEYTWSPISPSRRAMATTPSMSCPKPPI